MGKTGPKPTPIPLRVVGGQAEGENAAPLDPMPTPPEWLIAEGKAEWRRIGPRLHRLGLLSALDRAAFSALCQAYGLWAFAEKRVAELRQKEIERLAAGGEDGEDAPGLVSKTAAGNLVHHPLASIASKARAEYVKISVEFGLTPSSRARFDPNSAKTKAGGNAASRFLGRTRA